ncbi:MAG TPA: hypothetical protein VK630_15920 [Reyranella sp.]|nr:hypothetical protein [Reyranella sp.]
MNDKPTPAMFGRLALRREEPWWVAYYALADTMDRAIEIGRMRMRSAEESPGLKNGFMSLMQNVVTHMVQDTTGARLEWPNAPVPAPDHERKE